MSHAGCRPAGHRRAPVYGLLLREPAELRRRSIATKWKASFTDAAILAAIPNRERISLQHFDAEVDRFPYPDSAFDVIVCTEVLEHLAVDPMHMLAKMNRVARDSGLLVITTPHAASFGALTKVMAGQHP